MHTNSDLHVALSYWLEADLARSTNSVTMKPVEADLNRRDDRNWLQSSTCAVVLDHDVVVGPPAVIYKNYWYKCQMFSSPSFQMRGISDGRFFISQ